MRRTHSAPDMEKFRSILKSKGLKATPQRLAVHEAMLSMIHASADMVLEHIWKNGLPITAASVYNTLDQLCTIGIYKKLPSTGGKAWYDAFSDTHIHIYDRKRDEYRNLTDDDSASMITSWFKEHQPKGYRIDDIELRLVCHRSRRTNKTTSI